MAKGVMYRDGNGVKANHTLSFELFKKSAKLKNPKGLYHLGVNFEYGLGTGRILLLPLSLSRGCLLKRPRSSVLSWPHGCLWSWCEPEFLKALEMFTKAAEVGHVPSQIQVAKMHANGQGVAIMTCYLLV